MRIGDPKNWDRFQDALDEHYQDEDPIDISLGPIPNITMIMGDVKIVFVNPDFDVDIDIDEVMDKPDSEIDPEDLPINPDRMMIETPDEEFEVLIDRR